METAIQVVWWIGLIGAVGATLVILKQVAVILRVLGDIDRLADVTLRAARELEDAIAAEAKLDTTHEPAGRLDASASRLAAAASSIERKLDALVPGSTVAGG